MTFREILQPLIRARARIRSFASGPTGAASGRDAGGYRPDIDGLRAVAVLSVLFYHVGFTTFAGGYVGVDVFFVISGFLITRLIKVQVESGTFRFSTFYIRRARRLLPALLVTTACSMIAAFVMLSPQLLQEFGGSVVFTSLSLANWFFFRQSNYFDTSAISKPLLHTWSLGVEEQFYLVWPALIVVALTLWPKKRTPFLILAIGAASLVVTEYFNAHRSAVFYLTPFRAFEFAIGALVVWLVDLTAVPNGMLETGLLAGLVLVAASVAGLGTKSFSGLAVLTPCLGAALVLYCGSARVGGAVLRNRLAVGIGLISYSLYLVHWPIIVFLRYQRFEDFGLAGKWLVLFATVGAAVLLYWFVERPFRRRPGNAGSQSDKRFVLGYAAALALVVTVSAHMWRHGGWLWRYPVSIRRQIQAEAIERDKDYTWRAFGAADRPFAADARKHVLLIGDSQGADVVNMLAETGRMAVDDITTLEVHMQCQALISFSAEQYDELSKPDRASCAGGRAQLADRTRIEHAAVVILALNWDRRGIPFINRAVAELRRRGVAKVVVVGRKSQWYGGADVVLQYGLASGIEAYAASRKNPVAWDADVRIAALKRDFDFIDLMAQVCPTQNRCRVLTPDRDIILFDSSHFSPEGARYIGRLLLKAGAFDF